MHDAVVTELVVSQAHTTAVYPCDPTQFYCYGMATLQGLCD